MRKNRGQSTIEYFKKIEKEKKIEQVILNKKVKYSFKKAYKDIDLSSLLKEYKN